MEWSIHDWTHSQPHPTSTETAKRDPYRLRGRSSFAFYLTHRHSLPLQDLHLPQRDQMPYRRLHCIRLALRRCAYRVLGPMDFLLLRVLERLAEGVRVPALHILGAVARPHRYLTLLLLGGVDRTFKCTARVCGVEGHREELGL